MKSITSSLKNKIGISFCAALGLAGHSLMPLQVKAQAATTYWPNTVNINVGSKPYALNAVNNITFNTFIGQGLFTTAYSPWTNGDIFAIPSLSITFAENWYVAKGPTVNSVPVCGANTNPCTPDFVYFSGPATDTYLGYLFSANGQGSASGKLSTEKSDQLYFAYAMYPINSLNTDTISSNLPGQNPIPKLLPSFQGGVLSPNAADPQLFITVKDNFTVSSSTANAIDSAGKIFSFKGVLSDESAGQPGNITIKNSNTGTQTSAVFLQGTNSYTGKTTVESGVLYLQDSGSITSSSLVEVSKGASFDVSGLNFPYTAIQNLRGEGNVALGSTTLFLNNAQGDFKGVVKDSDVIISRKSGGSIEKLGSGVWALGGVNTYTGSTTISGGTLALAGNGSIASSAIINNEANFDISQIGPSFAIIKNINGSGGIQLGAKQLVISNADGLISGVIADGGLGGGTGGSLVKLGTATLELSGQNKFTGSTTINQGTLLLTGSVAGNTIVGSGATLVSNGSIGGNLSNLGTVTVGLDHGQGKGAGSLLTVSGSYAQGQAAIINYDIAGQTTDQLIVGKQIPAGGLQGEVHVAGTPLPGTTYVLIQGPVGSTGPAGVTSSNYKLAFDSYVIAKGTHIEYETDGNPATMDFKVVNDPVPIVNNTPLNNNSCVGAFCNAAVQAPGGSKGTASVAKVFDKSSNLINLVAGSVAQPLPPSAPSNPSPNPLPTPSAKPPVIIPAVSGGTTGISVENAVKALAPQAAAAGIGISSTSSTSSSASTPNQKLVVQAAAAIDHVQVQTELLRQPNAITYNNALRNLEGQPYGTWQSVMLESMARLRENAIELAASGKRFSTTEEIVSCGSGPWERGTADQAQSSSSGCTTKLAQRFLPWSMFADASATTATLQGSNNLASTDYSIGQSLYGIEYSPSTNWRAGAAFGYGQNALYGYQYANVLIANTAYSGVGWLTWLPGNFRVTGLYGYSTFDNNSNRNIRIGDAIDRTAVGNWKSSGNTVALEASYNWIINPNASASGDVAGMTYGKPGFTGVGPITIKPIASISYSNHVQPGFAESGANSLDLALQNHTAESWLSTLGVELKAPIVLSRNTAIVPRVMARWKHDFNGNANEERDINASYANLPSLGNQLIVGQNRGEDALQLVGGLEFEASNSSLYANVGYGSWSNGTELTWSGGMRYRW